EAPLVAFGKPIYSTVANGLKLGWLLLFLPIVFTKFGIAGAVVAVAAADLCRYVPIMVGQTREHFSFGVQDLLGTTIVFALIGLLEWLRWTLGFGTSLGGWPIHDPAGYG